MSIGAAEEHLAAGSLDVVRDAVRPFDPDAVARLVDVPADDIRRLARELAAAPSAAVYGRMGTTTSGLACTDGSTLALGTVASWLIDVVNVLIGALDTPGGVMWSLPPAGGPTTEGTPGIGRGAMIPGRKRTRVRGLPSVFGEFPAAALAEEIDTPGEDGARIRALITIAGNPVVSTPDSTRLAAALGSLDLMVSLDSYVTETSRHATVILPPPSPLARRHYDVVFNNLAIRNAARYSSATVPLDAGERDEADTLLRLTAIAFAIATGVPRAEPRRRGRPRGGDRRPADGDRRGVASAWPRGGRRPVRRVAATRHRSPAGPAHQIRALRGRIRSPSRRPHPRVRRGVTTRNRPRSAAPPLARGAAHGVRADRAGAAPARYGPRGGGRRAGRAVDPALDGAGRSPSAAEQQLVDAQPARPRRWFQRVHGAGEPGRRRPPWRLRRHDDPGVHPDRLGPAPGRGHRRRTARRRVRAAWLGPSGPRCLGRRRARAARGQCQ